MPITNWPDVAIYHWLWKVWEAMCNVTELTKGCFFSTYLLLFLSSSSNNYTVFARPTWVQPVIYKEPLCRCLISFIDFNHWTAFMPGAAFKEIKDHINCSAYFSLILILLKSIWWTAKIQNIKEAASILC